MGKKKPASKVKMRQEKAGHLYDFEKISFDSVTNKPKASDEELNSRYVKGDIRIVTEQARYPLARILDMLNEKIDGGDGVPRPRYKLDPEYQRRKRWNNERKSRLIESFLMNVPVPPVFLYECDLARFEVMDGRQRLTALSDFYADRFALTGLEYWSDLDGRKYSDLPSKVRDGIDRRYISSIILLKETATDEEKAAMLKKMVFERLNSGGVKLSSQEARNAVYDGPLNKLCLELSENEKFRRMWGIPPAAKPEEGDAEDDEADETLDESTKTGKRMFETMGDVELVLRFFAYRMIDGFRAGTNKMAEFLDWFIVKGNKFPPEDLQKYRLLFESTVDFLWSVLENKAFTTLDSSKKQPTRFIYDSIMFVASSPEVRPYQAKLSKNKAELRNILKKTYSDNQTLFAGRATNFSNVQSRNICMREAFDKAIAEIKQ